MHPRQLTPILLLVLAVPESISAFAPSGFSPVSVFRTQPRYDIATVLLRATDEDEAVGSNDDPDPPSKNLFQQINDVLNTPILDANVRSDQGPVAEALKKFVRREPQLASVTFSAVVLATIALLFRLYNFVTYGI
jgi:hypothetical protein